MAARGRKKLSPLDPISRLSGRAQPPSADHRTVTGAREGEKPIATPMLSEPDFSLWHWHGTWVFDRRNGDHDHPVSTSPARGHRRHLLEYSLVVLGLSTVALEPYLFVNAFYRLADLVNLLVSRLTAFF